MQDLGGVYVANVTPFKEDSLAVDEGAYLEHVAWLAEMGVRGVVPFGTNGEGPSVTLGEKLRVLEALFGRELGIQIIPSV
ncbi:MAG: dihydrodipicolinate synthase family protein, partial [Actinomycetota bacterium]|nr:dihydrodipicolinate synthase family protein [Actinomycetota bacterium]